MNTDLLGKRIQVSIRVYPRKSVAGFSWQLALRREQCTGPATAEIMISMGYVWMAGAIVRHCKSLSASGQQLSERRTKWRQAPAANNTDSRQRRRLRGFCAKNTKAQPLAGLPQLSF
jgi:hypothetical protein